MSKLLGAQTSHELWLKWRKTKKNEKKMATKKRQEICALHKSMWVYDKNRTSGMERQEWAIRIRIEIIIAVNNRSEIFIVFYWGEILFFCSNSNLNTELFMLEYMRCVSFNPFDFQTLQLWFHRVDRLKYASYADIKRLENIFIHFLSRIFLLAFLSIILPAHSTRKWCWNSHWIYLRIEFVKIIRKWYIQFWCRVRVKW